MVKFRSWHQGALREVSKHLFILLFAVSLALAIFLGTAVPVDSQQPANRQELEAEIKQYAARHAKQGEAKTDRILTLYRDNKFGLTPIQIEEIYETEFDRLKLPSSPTDQLPTWLVDTFTFIKEIPVWFALIVGFVFGIFLTSFRDQLKKGFDQVWEWFYQRLAGSAFLWNLALQRYRQTLIDRHEQLFIPFRPQLPLEMEQIYVALKVSGATAASSAPEVRAELDALQAVRDYPRLMVTGAPGSGKTMLLKYLVLSYAQGRLLLPGRPVLVLLELHRLSDPELTQEQLIQELVLAFQRYGWPQAGALSAKV